MLTRRNVILTGAAMTVGAAQADAITGERVTSGERAPLTQSINAQLDLAALCVEVSRHAGNCVRLVSQGAVSASRSLVESCHDASDICSVTATILSRQSPSALAICQACADACDRLVSRCAAASDDQQISDCRIHAFRCAMACRSYVKDTAAS